MDFTSPQLSSAVAARYLDGGGARKASVQWHRMLAGLFFACLNEEEHGCSAGESGDVDRALLLLPYHLTSAGLVDATHEVLTPCAYI